MGRATYGLATQEGAPPFPPGSNVFVFSRTLRQYQDPAVTVMSEVSPEAVERIRASARKDIWLFGGGQLFQSFLGGGFLDTVEVAVIPVLLGEGLPLLAPPAPRASLRLTKHRVHPSGIVWLEYKIGALR